MRGKFQLMSNWRDPSWRNLKDVMDGLEGDTRDARAGLFGENVIDIEEKPVFKLLIDEVGPLPLICLCAPTLWFGCLFR